MAYKQEITRKEYKAIIDEIILCKNALDKQLGEYTANAITRLIDARIKIQFSTIKGVKNV